MIFLGKLSGFPKIIKFRNLKIQAICQNVKKNVFIFVNYLGGRFF